MRMVAFFCPLRARLADQLRDGPAALPQCNGDTVRGAVARTDQHDLLAGRRYGGFCFFKQRLRRGTQIIERIENTGRFSKRQRPRLLRAAAEDHKVKLRSQFLRADLLPDTTACPESDALTFHKRNAAGNNLLRQFHFRDTIDQKPARKRVFFKNRHMMATAIEIISSGKSSRARTNHRDFFIRTRGRQHGLHQIVFKAILNDRTFVFPNRDRLGHLAADAGSFTQRRTDPACKLRERACLQQPLQRALIIPVPKKIVPLRDQVMQRAAEQYSLKRHTRLAKRYAAVHAAAGLPAAVPFRQRQFDRRIVACARCCVAERTVNTRIIQKSSRFSHGFIPPASKTLQVLPHPASYRLPHTGRSAAAYGCSHTE